MAPSIRSITSRARSAILRPELIGAAQIHWLMTPNACTRGTLEMRIRP